MKKGLLYSIFALIMMALPLKVKAQSYAMSLGATVGYAEDGFGGNFSINYHLDRWSYLQLSLFGSYSEERFNSITIPYVIAAVQPAYFRRLLHLDTRFPLSFYLGGGATGGYELINNGEELLSTGEILEAKSKFIYGGFIGTEIEMSITEAFSLALKASEHYHVNSDIGKLFPYVGIGMRYYLK